MPKLLKARHAWWIFLSAGVLSLFGVSCWRNRKKYQGKPWYWILSKSAAEIGMILLSAWRLPALLIGWVSAWVTKPIKHPALRITAGIVLGVVLGLLGEGFLELLMILSIFAVDMITGEEGFLGLVRKYDEEERLAA